MELTMKKILFLASGPIDTPSLRLGEEERKIREKLRIVKDKFTFEVRFAIRTEDIIQALLDTKPYIVHFAGHGLKTGELCVENDFGEVYPIPPETLADLFEQFKFYVRCVVLNACYSIKQAQAIGSHIEYVIGRNEKTSDDAAIAFSVGFYQGLGSGSSIEKAYELGCIHGRMKSFHENNPVLLKNNSYNSSGDFPLLKDIEINNKFFDGYEIPKHYKEFIGRQKQLNQTENALLDTQGKWIITFDGMGGIGKTALAREIIDRSKIKDFFEFIIWEQSPKDTSHLVSSRGMTYESILDTIALRLDALDALQMNMQGKEEKINYLLNKHRVLLVLDNLETAKEPQNELVSRLMNILSPSKALLTSRYRFSGDVFAFHIQGLSEGEAVNLILTEAENKHITQVRHTSKKNLKQLVASTGGSPLALKLLVGQLGFLPLDVVLEKISSVQISYDYSEEDDYIALYRNIFMPSWELLSKNAKLLLISLALFPAGIGGTFEALREISELSSSILTRLITELWRFSFIEVDQSVSLENTRYYLHALTQNFVLSDIVKK